MYFLFGIHEYDVTENQDQDQDQDQDRDQDLDQDRDQDQTNNSLVKLSKISIALSIFTFDKIIL